jgi:hypothetical protein
LLQERWGGVDGYMGRAAAHQNSTQDQATDVIIFNNQCPDDFLISSSYSEFSSISKANPIAPLALGLIQGGIRRRE